MSYSIILSDLSKTRNLVIDDNVPNTETSLTLFGPNVATFGAYFWENLLHLLEHFSNPTAPEKPIEGQIWYNSTNKTVNVCVPNGTSYKWVQITGTDTTDLSMFIDISKASSISSLKLGISEPIPTVYSGTDRTDSNACTKLFVDNWHGGVKTGSTETQSWVIYPNKFAIIQGVGSGTITLPIEMKDTNYSAVITNDNSYAHFKVTKKTTKSFITNGNNWMVVGIVL